MAQNFSPFFDIQHKNYLFLFLIGLFALLLVQSVAGQTILAQENLTYDGGVTSVSFRGNASWGASQQHVINPLRVQDITALQNLYFWAVGYYPRAGFFANTPAASVSGPCKIKLDSDTGQEIGNGTLVYSSAGTYVIEIILDNWNIAGLSGSHDIYINTTYTNITNITYTISNTFLQDWQNKLTLKYALETGAPGLNGAYYLQNTRPHWINGYTLYQNGLQYYLDINKYGYYSTVNVSSVGGIDVMYGTESGTTDLSSILLSSVPANLTIWDSFGNRYNRLLGTTQAFSLTVSPSTIHSGDTTTGILSSSSGSLDNIGMIIWGANDSINTITIPAGNNTIAIFKHVSGTSWLALNASTNTFTSPISQSSVLAVTIGNLTRNSSVNAIIWDLNFNVLQNLWQSVIVLNPVLTVTYTATVHVTDVSTFGDIVNSNLVVNNPTTGVNQSFASPTGIFTYTTNAPGTRIFYGSATGYQTGSVSYTFDKYYGVVLTVPLSPTTYGLNSSSIGFWDQDTGGQILNGTINYNGTFYNFQNGRVVIPGLIAGTTYYYTAYSDGYQSVSGSQTIVAGVNSFGINMKFTGTHETPTPTITPYPSTGPVSFVDFGKWLTQIAGVQTTEHQNLALAAMIMFFFAALFTYWARASQNAGLAGITGIILGMITSISLDLIPLWFIVVLVFVCCIIFGVWLYGKVSG